MDYLSASLCHGTDGSNYKSLMVIPVVKQIEVKIKTYYEVFTL